MEFWRPAKHDKLSALLITLPLTVSAAVGIIGCDIHEQPMQPEARWIQYHVLSKAAALKPLEIEPAVCEGLECEASWTLDIHNSDTESKQRLIHAVESRYDCGYAEGTVTTCRKVTESDIFVVELIAEEHSLFLRLSGTPW